MRTVRTYEAHAEHFKLAQPWDRLVCPGAAVVGDHNPTISVTWCMYEYVQLCPVEETTKGPDR